jgi:hypothetical protein
MCKFHLSKTLKTAIKMQYLTNFKVIFQPYTVTANLMSIANSLSYPELLLTGKVYPIPVPIL